MAASIQWTSRSKWQEIIASCCSDETDEYRRGDERRPASSAAVRLAFHSNGRPVQQTSRILNVSPSGLMIRHNQRLDSGTSMVLQADLHGEAILLHGRVVHCTSTVGGYKIGIELRFADDGADHEAACPTSPTDAQAP